MCSSKANGGRRCIGHSTERVRNAKTKLDRLRNELERDLGKPDNAETRKQLASKRRTVANAEAFLKQCESDHADAVQYAEERATLRREQEKAKAAKREDALVHTATHQKAKPEDVKRLTVSLTQSEIEAIRGDKTGSLSDAIRNRIYKPSFKAADTSNFKFKRANKNNVVGRNPTSSDGEKRQDKSYQPTDTTLTERLDILAERFGLSRSDVQRRMVNGIDLRERENHIGSEAQEERIDRLRAIEIEAGLGDASPREISGFWEDWTSKVMTSPVEELQKL